MRRARPRAAEPTHCGVLRQRGLDVALPGVGQLLAPRREELDAVVVVGVVRGADHDAQRQAQRARQVGHARGRQRAGEQDVDAGRGEPGLERRLDHVARRSRVLADQHGGPRLRASSDTRPTAWPSRSMKSGVMGACPTVPRMPSVPKYVLLIVGCPRRAIIGSAGRLPARPRARRRWRRRRGPARCARRAPPPPAPPRRWRRVARRPAAR